MGPTLRGTAGPVTGPASGPVSGPALRAENITPGSSDGQAPVAREGGATPVRGVALTAQCAAAASRGRSPFARLLTTLVPRTCTEE